MDAFDGLDSAAADDLHDVHDDEKEKKEDGCVSLLISTEYIDHSSLHPCRLVE